MASPKIVGVGNPLLDMMATADAAFLKKYELEANCAILVDEKRVPIYEDVEKSYDVTYCCGGSTQNSIRVAQALIGVAKSTAFVGAVGKDTNGKKMKEMLNNEGVIPSYAEAEKAPTGLCACLITGKDRSMVTSLGAANEFPLSHMKSESWPLVQSADYIYSAGFFLTVCPDAIFEAAQFATKEKKKVLLNLSAPFVVEFFKDPMMRLMPFVEYVIGNEAEAAKYCEVHKCGSGAPAWESAAAHIVNVERTEGAPSRTAIITRGSESTLVCTKTADGTVTNEYHPIVQLDQDAIVDTNGAGDAFVGGLLAGFVKGFSLKSSIELGNRAARHVIQRSGATFNFKDDDIVSQLKQ